MILRLYLGILLLSFIISLPLLLPYMQHGYFPTHDGEWAVVRAAEMFREIRDGQFPARVSEALNSSYGYPLFNFAYPMPYYLATLLHILKIGFVDSIKFLFAASIVLSTFFMFVASRKLWNNNFAGVVSAIAYAFLPYHLVDLYVRGSLGESIAYALFPLLIFLTLKLEDGKRVPIYVALASFTYAMLITTHNIMSVYFTLLLVGFIFLKSILQRRIWVTPILYIVGGLAIAAFFWLPALYEKKFIALSQTPIADRNLYFVNPLQLIEYRWGYAPPTEINGFSYQLGLPLVAILLIGVGVVFFLWRKNKMSQTKSAGILLILTALFSLLLFSPSKLIWEITPLLHEINYPWTLLLPIGFLVSLLAGFLMTQKKVVQAITASLVIITVVMYLPFAKPQSHIDRGDNFYLTNEATTTSSDELMPLWVKEKPLEHAKQLVEFNPMQGTVKDVLSNSKEISFQADVKTDTNVYINRIYYPGWRASINGQRVPIDYNNDKGIMSMSIPQGDHRVELQFQETPLRMFANMLSVFGIIIVVGYAVIGSKKYI